MSSILQRYINTMIIAMGKNPKLKNISERKKKKKAYTLAKRTLRAKHKMKHFGTFSPIRKLR